MMFSERKGYKLPSEVIQRDDMNDNLRTSLWNVLDLSVFDLHDKKSHYKFLVYSKALWCDYFKRPIDEILNRPIEAKKIIKNHFFLCKWYEVYDFLEFTINFYKFKWLEININAILERELSGYRFIDGIFTNITDQQEIELLETALADTNFPGVKKHLRTALDFLSNREEPDYRNSIKESISAVESLARIISGKPKATLDDALDIIDKKGKIHTTLRLAFGKLYGYTSNEDGIRHAMLNEPDISFGEAYFFLITCTAFVNYLKGKM